MILSVSGLYTVNDKRSNENVAVGGMRIGRETEVLGENLPQYHIAHHKSHMS
jgi:hypothetical protein